MDPSCISKTAGYTFNGGHVGGQAIYESVHSPLTGGGRRRRRTVRKAKRSAKRKARRSAKRTARRSAKRTARRSAKRTARRSAKRTARRSAKRTARRSAKRTARRKNRKRIQGRRAVYRGGAGDGKSNARALLKAKFSSRNPARGVSKNQQGNQGKVHFLKKRAGELGQKLSHKTDRVNQRVEEAKEKFKGKKPGRWTRKRASEAKNAMSSAVSSVLPSSDGLAARGAVTTAKGIAGLARVAGEAVTAAASMAPSPL